MDLEKEIKEIKHNYKVDDNRHTSICSADIEWLAKHFFELGLKAWLEKQGNKSEEYVFRPTAGCTIDEAAQQAVDKAANGENIVFSFNGFYIKIYKDTTINNIINSYNDFCKKQCEKNSK